MKNRSLLFVVLINFRLLRVQIRECFIDRLGSCRMLCPEFPMPAESFHRAGWISMFETGAGAGIRPKTGPPIPFEPARVPNVFWRPNGLKYCVRSRIALIRLILPHFLIPFPLRINNIFSSCFIMDGWWLFMINCNVSLFNIWMDFNLTQFFSCVKEYFFIQYKSLLEPEFARI